MIQTVAYGEFDREFDSTPTSGVTLKYLDDTDGVVLLPVEIAADFAKHGRRHIRPRVAHVLLAIHDDRRRPCPSFRPVMTTWHAHTLTYRQYK